MQLSAGQQVREQGGKHGPHMPGLASHTDGLTPAEGPPEDRAQQAQRGHAHAGVGVGGRRGRGLPRRAQRVQQQAVEVAVL